MRTLALLLAALTLAPAAAVATERTTPLAVGDEASEVTLSDQHGKPFRLTEALARREFIVLAFYVKAFTGG